MFLVLVNDVLRDKLYRFVFVYLDNIAIFSKSPEEHVQHVWTVVQRLLENSFFVKAEKCEFPSSVFFLGYIIAQGRTQMDAAKVWPSSKFH